MNTSTVQLNMQGMKWITGGQYQPDGRTQQYLRYAMAWAQDSGMTLAEFMDTELGRHPEFRSFILRNWNMV